MLPNMFRKKQVNFIDWLRVVPLVRFISTNPEAQCPFARVESPSSHFYPTNDPWKTILYPDNWQPLGNFHGSRSESPLDKSLSSIDAGLQTNSREFLNKPFAFGKHARQRDLRAKGSMPKQPHFRSSSSVFTVAMEIPIGSVFRARLRTRENVDSWPG